MPGNELAATLGDNNGTKPFGYLLIFLLQYL